MKKQEQQERKQTGTAQKTAAAVAGAVVWCGRA